MLKEIRLDEIRVNPIALREVNRSDDQFVELMNSIRSQGIITAISVREKPGDDGKKYELIDGLQRFTSAQEVGTGIVNADGPVFVDSTDAEGKTIKVGVVPANILVRDDAEALLTQIIGNVQRVETTPVQYAAGLRRLLGYYATWTIAELASKLNKSPNWIEKQLGLLKLHDSIKPLVDGGKITVSNAIVLCKLPPDEQLKWMDRAQTETSEIFGPAALARVKEIRDANRKGEDAGEAVFQPTPHLRKKPEMESELKEPTVLPQLIQELNILEGIKPTRDGLAAAARQGAALGIAWALNYDAKSQEAQRQNHIEREKRNEEQKIRRDAERKQKRAQEAAERTAKANDEAKAAAEKAAALGPVTPAPAAETAAATA